MTDWTSMKKAAEGDRPWNPVGGFDINGDIKPHSPINHEQAFGRAVKYGLAGGGLTWFLHWLLTRKKEDRIAAARNRLKWALGLGTAAAAVGYGQSVVEDAIKGTRFNYEGYNPKEKGDYNIVVAGAGSGSHDPWYKENYDSLFGKGKYVMFNPRHGKALRKFLYDIPQGSRVRIWAHSRGGDTAVEAARDAASLGLDVNQLNTVDIVGKPISLPRPPGIREWNNFYIQDRPNMNPSKLKAIHDFLTVGGVDGDLVATVGGPVGYIPEATRNILISDPKGMDHGSSINWAIKRQEAVDRIMRRKSRQ